MGISKAKRDFIFIDEAGDPGSLTDYYIIGGLHITDTAIKEFNPHLGALRYFGGLGRELKSTRLDPKDRHRLYSIINDMKKLYPNEFIPSAVYLQKDAFNGYWWDRINKRPSTTQGSLSFRHSIIRRYLEFHFSKYQPISKEVELVVDRFSENESDQRMLQNYLRVDKYNRLPKFLHIHQLDSRYVDLLQVADFISEVVKDAIFDDRTTNKSEVISQIDCKQIVE